MSVELLISLSLIFLARVCDVSMATFRVLLLVKGKRFHAAFVGFFEIMIYMFSLTYVLKAGGLDNIFNIMAYAAGFASGNFVGSYIDEKIMKGHVLVEVIMSDPVAGRELAGSLRAKGYGTTVLHGEGKEGERLVLKVVCDRRDYDAILHEAEKHNGFVFLLDLKSVIGGTTGIRKSK